MKGWLPFVGVLALGGVVVAVIYQQRVATAGVDGMALAMQDISAVALAGEGGAYYGNEVPELSFDSLGSGGANFTLTQTVSASTGPGTITGGDDWISTWLADLLAGDPDPFAPPPEDDETTDDPPPGEGNGQTTIEQQWDNAAAWWAEAFAWWREQMNHPEVGHQLSIYEGQRSGLGIGHRSVFTTGSINLQSANSGLIGGRTGAIILTDGDWSGMPYTPGMLTPVVP